MLLVRSLLVRNTMYRFGKPYARWGAVSPGCACTSAQLSGQFLTFEGQTYSLGRAFTKTHRSCGVKECSPEHLASILCNLKGCSRPTFIAKDTCNRCQSPSPGESVSNSPDHDTLPPLFSKK